MSYPFNKPEVTLDHLNEFFTFLKRAPTVPALIEDLERSDNPLWNSNPEKPDYIRTPNDNCRFEFSWKPHREPGCLDFRLTTVSHKQNTHAEITVEVPYPDGAFEKKSFTADPGLRSKNFEDSRMLDTMKSIVQVNGDNAGLLVWEGFQGTMDYITGVRENRLRKVKEPKMPLLRHMHVFGTEFVKGNRICVGKDILIRLNVIKFAVEEGKISRVYHRI
ncbi:hypothetical protein GLAREA_07241 [Glarea lozoyensis ATCC 20868]|uniref:Uncharacterized protein n=1 Tax=Glarea lozoyensis (strain ATCC 20868 / MF5171) TaxID=1116229 RepID=S3E7C3_GLAL2|nr:uncharacterized protein GLAREA_07241 [Glarea lozoyensis ATCC 20868]EPE34228.1 hypothetical protein GLAREA_07241 [Glarea lozoyensis ATCC 20868]